MKKKEEKRLKDLKNYILNALKDLKLPIEKQIDALGKFANELADNTHGDFNPEYISSLHVKNIRWISHEDLYRIFVSKEKSDRNANSEVLRKLNSDLDYLETFIEDLKESFNYFTTRYEKYEAEWSINMKMISTKKDKEVIEHQLLEKSNPDYVFPEFILLLDELYYTWPKMPNYDRPDIALANFLIPLQALCRKVQPNAFAFSILEPVSECIYSNTNLDALKSFIREGMLNRKKILERVKTSLEAYSTIN